MSTLTEDAVAVISSSSQETCNLVGVFWAHSKWWSSKL